jgi:hypothetical protein
MMETLIRVLKTSTNQEGRVMAYVFFTFKDSSKETSTVSFTLADLLPDGTNWAAIVADADAIQDALLGVCDGTLVERGIVGERTRVSNIVPTDGSERERKWLVTYEDNTTKAVYTSTLPNRKIDSMPIADGTDFVDLGGTDTERDDLIAAFNTNVVSPDGDNGTIISIKRVGRNL